MVNWVDLEHTRIPHALALALRRQITDRNWMRDRSSISISEREKHGGCSACTRGSHAGAKRRECAGYSTQNRDSNCISVFNTEARTLRTPKQTKTRVKIGGRCFPVSWLLGQTHESNSS